MPFLKTKSKKKKKFKLNIMYNPCEKSSKKNTESKFVFIKSDDQPVISQL